MPGPNISTMFDDMVGLPWPLQWFAARLLGVNKATQLYETLRTAGEGQAICKRVLTELAVTCRVGERDLQQIPRTGPLMIVANHPFGALEAAVLATVLERVRPDIRFLANDVLSVIPEIQDLILPVDVTRGSSAARHNLTSLRRSIEFLKGGGCLVVFPAGEVSHYQASQRTVTDSKWRTAAARMIDTLSRHGVPASVVPIFINGSNSLLFQVLGLIHPRLRTALLARELLNKRNRLVELRIGSPIAGEKLREVGTPEQQTEYLRWRTYVLAERQDYRAVTRRPLRNMLRHRRSLQVAACAIDSTRLADEVERLGPARMLAKAGDLEVYIASAEAIPLVLQEIGRLREITFRQAGEGTGNPTDLDRFDSLYLHLFAWNAAKHEIVGAYRFAGTDAVGDLYTATLFQYDAAFLDKMGPALELGRSFVRDEYQKRFGPLLALWKGIGAYIARNPRYKILFGPVSISNQYQAVSRELMVTFLERRASVREWIGLVANRNPLRRRCTKPEFPDAGFDLEDLSDVVSDLEASRAGIPVLLRQYLKLGGKLLGFNVDPEFSEALDGLILVDLTKTEPRLLDRYLGKAAASEFLKHHMGSES